MLETSPLDRPEIEPGDWITVGASPYRRSAVVVAVGGEVGGDAEAVYLNGAQKAVKRDVSWSGRAWTFTHPDPDGVRVGSMPWYAGFVARLRSGRFNS